MSDVSFVEWAAAVGENVGQGRLVRLVDLFGGGRLAVRLGPVVVAGLAAGLLGWGLGLPLANVSGAVRPPSAEAVPSSA